MLQTEPALDKISAKLILIWDSGLLYQRWSLPNVICLYGSPLAIKGDLRRYSVAVSLFSGVTLIIASLVFFI